jgi:Glycoside hydrolase family 44
MGLRHHKLLMRVELLEDRTAPAVILSVDANANLHAIDPRIYGVAFASSTALNELNAPTNRSGGNATSQYNWQINASNRGNDWYFESLADTGSNPGQSADDFIQSTRTGGAEAMITIPTIGWVAKLGPNRGRLSSYSIAKYGAQTGNDWQWFPDAGNGVQTGTNTKITWNDPNDANVPADVTFQQGWIQHLIQRWGLSSAGGQKYYFLDNEPSIWFSTHRDVHNVGPGMEEIRDKLINYSAMIHAADPGAYVMGPEEWGWYAYFSSGLDQQNGNNNDRNAHGGADYLPWVLQQLKANDLAHNTRTLDAFTVHYYPQGSGVFSNDVSTPTALLRNRSTRGLWDPNYVDQSWINTQVKLIPRLQQWVNTYYFPGTPVGVTEYNWGAEGNTNGATAQADVWGIFGREGLNIGNRWTTPAAGTPTYLAMKLWRNYDGADHGFGDVSMAASAPNPDQVSVFASRRSSDGALTVAVINKNLYDPANPGATTQITVNLNNFAGTGTAQFWRLAATSPSNQTAASITQQSGVTIDANNSFTFNAAMQSVNLFVIMPASQPAPTVQSLQVGDGSAQRSSVPSVTLTFSERVALGAGAISVQRIGPGGALGSVAFTIDTSLSTATQTIAKLTFSGPMTWGGSLIDGNYQLSINRNLVLDTGGRSMAADYSTTFFRFYGDANGDRHVDIADFGLFSATYGLNSTQAGYLGYFDYNGDGHIDIADFGQFSIRMFTTLP